MWNASRAGWNLDQLTDFMISNEAKRKGLQIQGSVSNVIPFALAEINVYTNVVYTDSSSNTVDRFDISYETNLVYKSLSGDLQ